jgi:hypothetical protein
LENIENPSNYWTSKYLAPLNEYLDPLHFPSTSSVFTTTSSQLLGFVLEIEIQSYLTIEALKKQSFLQLSPFKVSLKFPGYKKSVAYLPLGILPNYSFFDIIPGQEGSITQKKVMIFMCLNTNDEEDFTRSCDPGSKPWLVSQALHNDDADAAAYENSGEKNLHGDKNAYTNPFQLKHSMNSSNALPTEKRGSDDADRLPEDRFHITLPDDVDPYTGIKYDQPPSTNIPMENHNLDDFELPEDRFHRKDAGSSFLINQREQSKKDKWDRHEK